jgi:hypothetical protein
MEKRIKFKIVERAKTLTELHVKITSAVELLVFKERVFNCHDEYDTNYACYAQELGIDPQFYYSISGDAVIASCVLPKNSDAERMRNLLENYYYKSIRSIMKSNYSVSRGAKEFLHQAVSDYYAYKA